MKVLSVMHFPEFGGPHNQTLRLSAPLRQRGIESVAVLPEGAGADRLRSGGVDVRILPLGRVRAVKDPRIQGRMIARFPVDMWQLIRLIRKEQPDVVMLSGLMNPHGAIVARLLGIPVTWQLLDTRPPRQLRSVMMKLISRLADSLMPVGHQVALAHPGASAFAERMVVFYPPVDLEVFRQRDLSERPLRIELGIPDDAPVVGVVGNINPQKGHEYFLDAAAQVKRSIPDARFVIAGHIYPNHAMYFHSLLERAEAHGLIRDKDVFFLGPRQDIPDVMASIDVFALASVPNSEGTPTVILEAMACGLPVVASDVASVSEVVADGETGYVVPSMQPSSMAERISCLLANRDRQQEFGHRARKRVEAEFSMDACVEAHVKAFRLAIRHRGSKRK
jgi:glycosyltransferase involved in cell wall biosynthesis